MATFDDVERLAREGVREHIFRERLVRGDHCVLVLKGDRVVAWSWSTSGRLYVSSGGIRFDTGNDGFFLYDVYTAPEERLKGFILGCFKRQVEHYRARGGCHVMGTISPFNTESLRTHLRMGFRICGETIGFTVAGIRLCYYRSWLTRRRRIDLVVWRPGREYKSV